MNSASFLLSPVGLMTSWPTCFLKASPRAVRGGKVPVGFLLWQPVLLFRFSLLGLFYLSTC